MAGVHEAQDAIPVHNEVATELRSVITMRVVEFTTLEPAFDVDPYHAWMPCTQARPFKLIDLVGDPFTIKENSECAADFLHPLLDAW